MWLPLSSRARARARTHTHMHMHTHTHQLTPGCGQTYDRQDFIANGINHVDLYFDDCTVPPPDIVNTAPCPRRVCVNRGASSQLML